MGRELRLISWNVKGLNNIVKRNKVLAHLRLHKAEIAFLQETHLHNRNHPYLNQKWNGQFFHSSFQAKARGVAILIDKNVPFTPNNIIADKNGRYIIVTGTLCKKNLILANFYAPNFDDITFFLNISLLPDLNSHSLILGGDFNCCLDASLDRSSSKLGAPSRSSKYLNNFFSDNGLSDIWRFLNPQKREYSFFSNVHHSYSRIDYFVLDNALISDVCYCAYQSIIISDHAPLVLDLKFSNLPSLRRSWRLNTSLLADDDFVGFISDQISFFLSVNISPDVSNIIVWDALKAYIRGQIISYNAIRKRKLKEKQISLADEIKKNS